MISHCPETYRTADMRVFFSTAVVDGWFVTFHYKHTKRSLACPWHGDGCSSYTCVVRMRSNDDVASLIKLYHNKSWHDRRQVECDGIPCCIVQCSDDDMRRLNLFRCSDLHPPSGLPNGNVATPIDTIVNNINNMTLPPSALKGLDNDFLLHSEFTLHGPGPRTASILSAIKERSVPLAASDDDDDDDDIEDFDRYISQHPEVSRAYNDEQPLFEQLNEKPWDKGDASALVWYTDAQYWAANTDPEPDVDDYDAEGVLIGADDADGRRQRRVPLQDRLDPPLKVRSVMKTKPNSSRMFDKPVQGIGSDMLKSMGWKEGQILGTSDTGVLEHSQTALKEPLDPIRDLGGRAPKDRRGLGYGEEKP